MKKILFVVTKSNWGGAQRYVFDLATSLPRDQFEPVVTFGGHGALESKLRTANVRTLPLSNLARDISIGSDGASFLRLIKILWQERPDVVHLNSPKAAGLGALAASLMLVPKIIYTVHGWTFNEERPAMQKLLIKIVSWITVLLTDKTICIAERERAQIANWKFIGNKVVVIHNGISSPQLKSRELARQTLSDKNVFLRTHLHDLWLGTIAELHPNKGLDLMLDALHEVAMKYTGICYVIVGEGQERVALENKIKLKQLENIVYLVGHVDSAQEYLTAFDAFVLPSRKEGFPYAILEAGRAELPVIASNVGGISEVVKTGETGILTDPTDGKTLEAALDKILSDEPLRRHLGHNLKQLVDDNFSLDQMIKKTIALY